MILEKLWVILGDFGRLNVFECVWYLIAWSFVLWVELEKIEKIRKEAKEDKNRLSRHPQSKEKKKKKLEELSRMNILGLLRFMIKQAGVNIDKLR